MDRNQTRVDQPHLVHSPAVLTSPSDHGLLLELAGHSDEGLAVERQAIQLADRLNEQQRDLDRREAEFNARSARMENELRTARLVNREREHKILETRAEFEMRLTEMRQRNADLISAQAAMESEAQDHREKHHQQLDQSRQSVETWQKKLRAIENSEKELHHRFEKLSREKNDLESQRKELDERAEKLAFIESGDLEQLNAIAEERERLARQAEELEYRQANLERLHNETARIHREELELKLANQQIWAELSDQVPPDELAKRVEENRSKLSREFGDANRRLAEKQVEIRTLIERLASHQSQLTRQRDEVRGWVTRRQQEIEQQAQRLIDREQDLDRHETNLRHFERKWRKERECLEQEIADLHAAG